MRDILGCFFLPNPSKSSTADLGGLFTGFGVAVTTGAGFETGLCAEGGLSTLKRLQKRNG